MLLMPLLLTISAALSLAVRLGAGAPIKKLPRNTGASEASEDMPQATLLVQACTRKRASVIDPAARLRRE